ncbi:ATP-binding cassette domain-containing protein [Agromyces sp. NPDC058484]|uniref:ATP-binding cassette domain-containing protein n=1 Tax=Agromyces sp. NPDC058484 TaxID=3346524 RepID=UPI00365306AB
MAFIEARGLVKRYFVRKAPPVHALDGVDLSVEQGTVRALLGPNGAGKTTAVKVFTTLLVPDEGTATIGGIDVLRHGDEVRPIIGVSGQYAAVDEDLTGFENLDMVGRLYHFPASESRRRAHELIDAFELTEAQNRPVKGFSGGMRRRIDLAGAIFSKPQVLFLDEPTTGLDPRSRMGMWEIIQSLVSEGTTVFLTTQYLEEADRLADAISVIDGGRVIAEGTADELKAQVGGQQIELTVVDPGDAELVLRVLARHGASEPRVSDDGRTFTVGVAEGPLALESTLRELNAAGVRMHDVGMRRPTLDDVFLKLTGHMAETDAEADEPPRDRAGADGAPRHRATADEPARDRAGAGS